MYHMFCDVQPMNKWHIPFVWFCGTVWTDLWWQHLL